MPHSQWCAQLYGLRSQLGVDIMDICFLHIGENRSLPEIMVRSARLAMRDARIVQFTDESTLPVAGVDEVIRRPVSGEELMIARLDHLACFEHREALFLDTDIIVRRDLRKVFDLPFDVALTRRYGTLMVVDDDPFRPHFPSGNLIDYMPYNAGVMFSRTRDFWVDCRKACESMHPIFRRWYGDQMALKAVVEGGDYAVVELAAHKLNYAPEHAKDWPNDALILHFKGARKAWMKDYPLAALSGSG